MEKELLEKEVLCILDTRQIQRYMFRTNTFFDTIGGSDLMVHVLMDAICDAMISIDTPLREEEYDLSVDPDVEKIPYFSSEKIQFQLIICAAGNALCIVRTGALCQKIIRRISRFYLEHGYSLNLTAAATEKTDHLGNDIFHLYKKLNNIKASSDISDPLGTLPVVMREKRTGEPVVAFDEENGDFVSRSSMLRRAEAKKRENCIGMPDIRTTQAADGKEYLAFLHADGNNLGITIGRILQETKGYQEGIIKRRRINRNIEEAYRKIMEKTEREVMKYYLENGGSAGNFPYEFQVFHRAGDDINLMCNALLAFPFLDFFYKNLEGTLIWEKDGEHIPLYVCAGISFVTRDSSFHAAYHLAEECCQSAKAAAKDERNLRDGLAGNWMDFQICDQPNVQELDMQRDRSYQTFEGINLLLRPYSRDQEDLGKEYHIDRLLERVAAVRELRLEKTQMTMLKQSYLMGRQEFGLWIKRMKKQGVDLTEKLGPPTLRDRDQQIHAVWFDAAELLDFIP